MEAAGHESAKAVVHSSEGADSPTAPAPPPPPLENPSFTHAPREGVPDSVGKPPLAQTPQMPIFVHPDEATSTPGDKSPSAHARRGHHGTLHRRQRPSSSSAAHASVVKKRNSSIASSLRIVTFTLWGLTTLTALTLGVVADVFQAEQPHFPFVPVVITSVGLNLVAVLLVLLLGKLTRRGFAVFQPFTGGQTFALMQAAGYTLAVVCAVATAILVESVTPHKAGPFQARYGVYTVLSGFTAFAQVLLVTSLIFFHTPKPEPTRRPAEAARSTPSAAGLRQGRVRPALSFWDITQSPAREYAFSTLCCLVMVVSAAVAEVYAPYRPISVVLVVCFASVALATTASLARVHVSTYRMFVLTPQALPLTALQLLGNALLLCFVSGSVMLHSAGTDAPVSWHVGVALMGVTGVCCHQLLLRLTQSREKEAAVAAAAFADAVANPTSPLVREFTSAQMDRSRGSLSGAAMSSAVSATLSAAVYAISIYLSVGADRRSTNDGAQETVVLGGSSIARTAASHRTSSNNGAFVAQGLAQVQVLLVVLLFALPPFTHLQGRLVFGKTYEIWQPFKGSVEFVLLQAAAWASYGFAILFGTLYASEPAESFSFLFLLTTCLLLSQLFVHVSLHLFDESKHSALFHGVGSPTTTSAEPFPSEHKDADDGATSEQAEERARSLSPSASHTFTSDVSASSFSGAFPASSVLEMVMNGELLLSIVLSVVSMLIRGVCDTVEQVRASGWASRTAASIPTEVLVGVATGLSLLATPIAQLSMRHRIPLVHVTSTSNGFNVTQTIAWLVYLSLLFMILVNAATGEQHLFMCTQERQFMEHTAQGLLLGIPFLCVVISDFCEAQERRMDAARAARVQRAADALLALMDDDADGATGSVASEGRRRRVVELVRTIAGPRLTSADWGLSSGAFASASPPVGGGPEVHPFSMNRSAFSSAPLDEAERERVHADEEASITAARYITAIMCLACTAAFVSAAFLADAQPVITLFFGGAGVLVLTLSCVSLQYVLGNRLHGGTGTYALFMPFVGGRWFVAWQALGWTCYTVVMCLMIACVVEGRGSRFVFFTMSALSLLSEAAIFHSIPLFDAEAETATAANGFLGRNAEGILAAVILLGTFSFARAYDMAEEGSVSSSASALVPLVIMSIAMCLTVPMGLLSLQRQAEHYGVSPFSFFDSMQESDEDTEESEEDGDCYGFSRNPSSLAEMSGTSPPQRDRQHHRRNSFAGVDGEDWSASRTHGAEEGSLSSRNESHVLSSRPMSPARRDGLVQHARTESLTTPITATATTATTTTQLQGRPSLGLPTATRRSSFATDTPVSGNSSLHPGSPHPSTGVASPFTREVSAFAASINLNSRRGRAPSYTIAISYAVSLVVALFLVLLLPFALVFVAYSYVHEARLSYAAGARTLEILVSCFVFVVTVPMVVAPVARRSRVVRWLHSAFCAWSIYSVPTITVVSGISPPFFINSRGAWLFAINMCSMACLSTIPYVHLIAFIFSVVCCGYFAQYHLYTCLYRHRETFVLWKCVFDLVTAAFWLWYGRRFVGRPEVTGRYQSNRATRFFQTYFFEGMTHWFSLKVVRAELYLLPSERDRITLVHPETKAKSKTETSTEAVAATDVKSADDGGLRSLTHRRVVDRSDPSNQYLLSFHPHGVFPGTALYGPKTRQFEHVIGTNSENFISTHCADIVFSVPLMRELPLCLGCLSVGRAGIDHSIGAGNTALIVTGGQSEMLLVRMSAKEMHLVCHHLGFVKVAMRHRIPLVPVLSFSECNIMDNVHCLDVQRWFLKRIGFPFPTLPHGFFKLPLPTNTPMSLVIGPPLMPLPGRDDWEDVACQEEMRIRYFCHLEYLFYRYRTYAGYPEMQLYLHYGVDDAGVLASPPAPGVDVATEYVLDEENAAIRRAIAANKRNREAREAKRAAARKASTGATSGAAVNATGTEPNEEKKQQ